MPCSFRVWTRGLSTGRCAAWPAMVKPCSEKPTAGMARREGQPEEGGPVRGTGNGETSGIGQRGDRVGVSEPVDEGVGDWPPAVDDRVDYGRVRGRKTEADPLGRRRGPERAVGLVG